MQFGKSSCYSASAVGVVLYRLRFAQRALVMDQPQHSLQSPRDEEANLYYNKHPTDVHDLTSVFQYPPQSANRNDCSISGAEQGLRTIARTHKNNEDSCLVGIGLMSMTNGHQRQRQHQHHHR
jgi:hypothetical protein